MTTDRKNTGRQRRVAVLVADRVPLFREAIARAVRARPELELVGESSSGSEVEEAIVDLRPQVAVLDVALTGLDSAALLALVTTDGMATRLLFLSSTVDAAAAYELVGAGAAGYLSKDVDANQLCEAIAAVARGQVVLAPDVQTGLASEIRLRRSDDRPLLSEGRGATVNAAEEWNRLDSDVLAALLTGPEHDRVLDDAIACRSLGEIETAALAAECGSSEEVDQLWAAFRHMDACAMRARTNPASADVFDQADLDFHHAIARASGNLMLGQIIEPVHHAISQAHPPAQRIVYERVQDEHRRIVEAIEGRDPEKARSAMGDHLDSLAETLRRGRGPRRASIGR